jgi:RNA polymerase sigma-70 factor (ECF subfamily)
MFGKKPPKKQPDARQEEAPANTSADTGEEGQHLKDKKNPKADVAESSLTFEGDLAELYREMAPQLFRYGVLLTRDFSLAQDAVQETFLRYYLQRKQGEVKAERAWLFRVLRNYVLDLQKSVASKMSVGLEEARFYPDKSHSPDRVFEQSEAVKVAIQVLSPRELQCLQLRTEGFSYREIAQILGIETGTVGALLARGADKIRKAFGGEGLPCEAL